jgi:hypothetical protein
MNILILNSSYRRDGKQQFFIKPKANGLKIAAARLTGAVIARNSWNLETSILFGVSYSPTFGDPQPYLMLLDS